MDALQGAALSKTIWFNTAVTILGIIDAVQAHGGWVAALIPNTGPLMAVIGIVGIVLRAVTTGPLASKVQ